MAWYQARRHLLDFVNSLDLECGVYIETDCIKWVRRFGLDLRPLNPGETPKPTFKKIIVTNTVEDQIKEVKVEVAEVKEEVAEVKKVVEPVEVEVVVPVKRRKLKTAS